MEATTSLEQGLLLPANPLMKLLVEAAMSRAQELHPVRICHYLVECSHIHFLIMVDEPKDMVGFMERFKTESAHYINSMLGRRKRTVWCESFFCAPVLTVSSVMKKIKYIYTNPAKDNLENSIELYPGLSSWEAYCTGRTVKSCLRMSRSIIPYLPEKTYTRHTYKQMIKNLKKLSKNSQTLTITPDAWMEFFRIENKEEKERINKAIKELIFEEEAMYREKRKLNGKSVIGCEALKASHLELDYIPERTGKKMWCISDDKDLRISYIAWAKELMKQAREVYKRWLEGDYSMRFPIGVFAPALPRIANLTVLGCCY